MFSQVHDLYFPFLLQFSPQFAFLLTLLLDALIGTYGRTHVFQLGSISLFEIAFSTTQSSFPPTQKTKIAQKAPKTTLLEFPKFN